MKYSLLRDSFYVFDEDSKTVNSQVKLGKKLGYYKNNEKLSSDIMKKKAINSAIESLLSKKIDWSRVNAFHMDEYIALSDDAPQGFRNFLRMRLFEKVTFHSVHYLNGNAENITKECKRYEGLLKEFPTDIVCMGIGENGHIAFNDPPVADFNDLVLVKQVELEAACRQQQVNDGCFDKIADVPKYALTLTIPALFYGRFIFCIVPGIKKKNAVFNTLHKEIIESYPSTILRKHSDAILFLDKNSASLL
jgi:glucosamine-6-phosphate deaminase